MDLISVKSNLNLCPKFAQEYIEYTITIDKTQGSDLRITKDGAVVMESDTVHYGEVLSIVYTIREGYEFVSFETQGLEQDGDNFTVTGNVVIVFREKVLTWDVTVYTTQEDSQVYEVPRNVDIWTNMPYIDSMKNYTNEEYTCGFYTDPEMRDFLPYDAKLTGNITLYTRIATLDKLSFENHYTNNNVDYFYVKAFNDQIPGEVVIPLKKKHTSGSKPVASLKASAFKNCVNMTSIFICNNITNIPTSAFENCPLITELTIPENITAIDRNAVKDCNNLVLINYLAKSATADYDKYDGYSSTSYYSEDIYMMRGSELGCKVIIGNKVTKVPVRMFMKSNITELEFQEGAICSTIENYAFAGCENLIKIQIPSTVTSFGRAFLECVSVKEVYIDTIEQWLGYSMPYASVDSDDYYNGDTSNGWSTYNSYYTNPLNYGANLYVNGALLTDLVIPAGVESIKDYTFKNCDSLQAVIIPEGVKTIGRDAFRYCTNLNSLSIASTVETIGESAFAMCKKLGQINYNATNAKDGNANFAPFEGSGADRCIVNIGDSVTRLNRALFYKSRITEVVFSPNTRCSTIGYYTFNECLRLQDIILPATIKTIHASAFSEFLRELYNNTTINITAGIYGLSSSVNIIDMGGNSTNRVYIENGFKILVKASKYYLLDYVGSDKNVVLPDYIDGNAYEVADYAFYQNVDIQSITIPATINKIGKNSFVGCTNLKRVFIFDIEKWMQIEFNNSSPLQNGADLYLNDNVVYHIDVPNGITEVKDYTFDGCTSIMSINIPNGTRIGTRAFYNCINLTRVTVPSNLQVIAQYAFYNCKKLTDFAIPSGLTEINSYAFYGCQSLTSAPIPSTLTILGDYAFYDCYMLEQDVTIPSGVAQIGNYAFYNCRRLQSLTLEQGNLTTIGSYAFVSCVKISELLIPEGVTSINANAFVNCHRIEVVSIPSTVRSILYAFSSCISIQTLYINDIGNWTTCSLSSSNSVPVVDSTKVYIDGVLATNIIIPDGITQISSYAFYKFKDLKSIHIPNSVQSIGTSAFESAESLESIIIPEGVEKIKNSTFYNCLSLKSVTIPSSINFVADYAFYNCKALEKVNIADMEKWMQIEFDVYEPTTISSSYSGYANPLYYGADLYLNNQKVTELIVPNSITNILDFTFYNCKSFEYVVIPEGVTAIGKGAFNGCSNIKSISFPSTLKTIGYNAFANCSSLQNINLSKNVTRIDSYAFYNCTAATSVAFSNVLTNIGSYAFYNCSSLQNLILPDSITSLGSYSFTNCTELENVIIGEGLTRFGSYAFENCTNIKQITLPSTLTQIATAFYNCTGIERVNVDTIEQWLNFSFYVTAERTTGNIISNPLQYGADLYVNDTRVTDLSVIPEDITSIPQYAFYGCYGFTEITVPNYIKSIGKYAFGKNSNLTKVVLHSAISSMANSFNGCYKLVDVVIEDGIQTISDGAFENCTAIKSIAFPSSVKTIGVEAFKGCSGLVLVTLPNELTTIKERAFQNCKSIITIELPSSLKTIGDNAFAGTTYLKEVRNASALEVKAGSFGIGASVKIIKTGESQYITEGEFIFSKTQTTGEGEDIKYDYVLVGYTGKSTNVILPDLVKGNPYSIKEELFYNNDYITSVTISRNVLKIGARAFAGCDNLTRIVYNAISADNENTSSLNSNNPFYGTGSKTTCVLQIGSLVTYIPNNLFRASNISEIVFGSRTGDCLEMGKYVFAECDYIINVEIIPLINVGEYAFYECDNLTSVVSKELTTLGANSFRNCKKLQSVILQGTSEIKNGAFYSCAAITNLNLGFGLQHIKENAFVGCNGLVDVVLPTGLSSIGSAAFKDCFNLKSIVLPDTLDTIADDVFKNTPQLLEVFNNSAYVFLEMGSCALSLDVSIVNYACVNPIIERDGLRFVEFNKKYYLIEYVGFDTDIVLPNNINGQSYQIRSYAFYNLDFIRSITIPTGVTAIGDYAFKDCDNLETVIIGEEVGSIGEQAFYSCDNLMQIDIGVGLSSIGNEAFRYCSNLTNVTILEGLTKIGNYTFADCTKLETILLSSGLKTIGSNAFQNCSSLLGIDIPVGVTSIGNYVFENCSSMTYVNVPQGLTNIGDYAFRKCSNLLEIIIPEGVTYLGPDVFKDCVSLKTIYLPKTLRTIKTQAFYGCSSLELMDIPVGVSTLENYTFYNCSSLRQISIPSTIISVGKYVFSGCTSLEKINLPERITYISENTFYNCKSLIEVLIPVGVTSIGDYAFYGCSSLKEIDIPETVNEIGKYAFADCSYLQQITIPDAVTAISQALFSNCIRLKWAQIPKTVKTIGANAFYNCNCLEWFIIPEGVKTIENETFYQCWDMEWITIASTVTKIGNKAFYRCETLKELTLPVAVEYIGSDAFRRCIDLLEVVIPGAITFIGNRAFDDCELLDKVVINNVYVYERTMLMNQGRLLENATKVYIQKAVADSIPNINEYMHSQNYTFDARQLEYIDGREYYVFYKEDINA
ncbi:MAG: leucine-rich repeat domain-containing protein [Clostridia bacterium]|nr:leucine-rich repeat domain-containing protein [Clostridia bacterium]